MMKSILVTGANGFVGRNIIKYLKRDYKVYGCDLAEKSIVSDFEYFKWDIINDSDPIQLKDVSVDLIVHAAACLSQDNLNDALVKVNCVGTFNIVKFAAKHNTQSIVYFSSMPIVGNNHDIPVTENCRVLPPTMYHASKAAGELIVSQSLLWGIHYISLRLPSPIGPDMPLKTILPIFVQKAIKGENIVIQGKGTRKQNYIDVRDLANAVLKILKSETINGIFQIGSKSVVSNFELAKKCISVLKSNSIIVYSRTPDNNDYVDWTTDDSLLRKYIGDYQNIPIEQSILDIADRIKNENSVF